MTVKIVVTLDRFEEVIDLADKFDLGKVNVKDAFDYLCQFVVDDTGAYVGQETGAKAFKVAHVKSKEIGQYWLDFVTKANEAFVPKVRGATSEEQS